MRELKDSQTALVLEQPQALQPITPLSMIQLALQQGMGPEVLRDLFKLKQEVDADEARKAYDMAFAAFKAQSIRIVKNIEVTAGPLNGKKYADLLAVVEAVTDKLSAHGLSSSWKITKDEPQWIEVTCTLRHERGHAESVSMGGPPDAGGAKNAIQARASTVTYLQRYTLLAATGLAAGGQDNDGATVKHMSDDQFIPHQEAIQEARNSVDLKAAFAAAYKAAEAAGDSDAMKSFIKLKDARKAGLL
jgi:hypothetical protein